MKRVLFIFVGLTSLFLPRLSSASYPYLNEISVDVPFDGGGYLTLARQWRFNRFLQAGFEIGGGIINRDFDLTLNNGQEVDAETSALILPYVGPRVTLMFHVIGISVGYGAFYAKTELDVSGPGIPALSGETSGWGTGFHAPFLVVDFYDRKRDMVFGFGLGGFAGSSYPELTAVGGGVTLTTDENPLDSLTFHVRMLWSETRRERLRRDREL